MHYAKLFMSGNSQAVRIPKAFRMPGKIVKITRQGNGLLIEPVTDEQITRMGTVPDDFPDVIEGFDRPAENE